MNRLEEIKNAIFEGEDDLVTELVSKALKEGETANSILQNALLQAMTEIGNRWNAGDIFMPEVMGAAGAFQKAATDLEPFLAVDSEVKKLGTIVIGTVYGDLHNLGKNLVAVMLRTGGFNVIDLGVNVAAEEFIEAAKKHNAQIIGLSALLTTTMVEQKKLIDMLSEAGLRSQIKVIVGGAPISQQWADDIGADGYGRNAGEAVTIAKSLIS